MAVKIVDDATKEKIAKDFLKEQNKASVGRKWGISPRTVGRIFDEIRAKKKWNQLMTSVSDVEETEGSLSSSPKHQYHATVTDDSITVVCISAENGEVDIQTITSLDKKFDEIHSLVSENGLTQDTLELAFSEMSVKHVIEKLFKNDVSIDVSTGTIYAVTESGNVPIHGKLHSRLIEAANVGDESILNKLTAFTANLALNPSSKAVGELFEFLEASDIEITDEGQIICFKKVRSNFYDCHSNSFDNSPGNVLKMPRNQVDDDSDRTCSNGLHVCSKAYLEHFGGDRVIRVLVHPKDVVSIPKDYYSVDGNGQVKAKMRCCEYYVIDEVTDW